MSAMRRTLKTAVSPTCLPTRKGAVARHPVMPRVRDGLILRLVAGKRSASSRSLPDVAGTR